MSTIITRLAKGDALTNDEVDSNFTNLNTDLVSTQANVTAANIQIATLQANTGSFHTYANSTFSTSSYGNTQVQAYLPTYSGSLANSSTIRTLDANLGTATTTVTALESNAAAQANQITGANAACVSANTALKNYVDGQVTTTQGLITTANTEMKGYVDGQVATKTTTTYVDSAVSTAVNNLINSAPGTLDTLGEIAANLASGSSATGAIISSITATDANVTAANARIATLDANLGSATTNITTLFANAATQSAAIDSKAATSSLATVATTGSYTDLTNKPTIPAEYTNTDVGTYLPLHSGNVSAAYFIGNGSKLTGIGSAYTDSNVAAYLPTYTGSLAASSSIVDLYANAATQGSAIAVLTANAGAQATAIAAKADTSSLAAVATSGSYNDLSSLPTIPTQYSDSNVAAVLAGTVTVGNITSTNGYFWANGTAYSSGAGGGTYGNTQVAAYLPGDTTITGIQANLGTATTNITTLFGNAATQSTDITGITGGTTTLANVISTGGYFWANGTAYSSGGGGAAFTGNLLGSTLSDSTNLRVFVNATGTSAPTVTNYAYTKNITAPNYIGGVLNLKPTTIGTASGQVTNVTATTCQTSSNIPLQSQYGASGGITTAYGAITYVQVYPVTANTMNNNDRVRAHGAIADVIMTGQTWGSNAAGGGPIGGMLAVTNAVGYGNVNGIVGMSSLATVSPTDTTQTNNMDVTYLTGYQSFCTLYAAVGGKANVAYARALSAVVTGIGANTIVQNAVALHTASGWAGGSPGTSAAKNQFALLNEDNYTQIQTKGNIIFSATATLSTVKYGQYTVVTANGLVGQIGMIISIFDGTAKNAGQMAYWDGNNARWSWIDTNLAVS